MGFNNKKAWHELVCPALMSLSPAVHQLVLQVIQESRGIKQNPDLSVPWPSNSNLRDKFDELSSEELSKASRIVWAAGHWHPGTNNWFRPLMRTQSYWKFSSWADEVLRDRCDLSRNSSVKNVFSFEIHEGFIRVCIGFDKSFQWHEVALATEVNIHMVKKLAVKKLSFNKEKTEEQWKEINSAINSMKKFIPKEEPIATFFNLKEFTDEF